jgi:hypothetical protein
MATNSSCAWLAARRSVVLCGIVYLGGCGDAPAPGASTSARLDMTAIRACELLTAAQIEAATGVAPAPGEDRSQVGGQIPICNWAPAGSQSSATLVSLLVAHGGYDTYEEYLERARETPLGAVLEGDSVSEVDAGDFGVWMHEARMLQVYDGPAMVQLTIGSAAGGDGLDAARTLAVAAHAELP